MKVKLSLLFLIAVFQLKGQELIFSDSKTGESIPGVAIQLKSNDGDSFSLVSNTNGRIDLEEYSLPLEFFTQHIAYESKTVSISSRQNIKINLTPHTTHLDDVVVTGQFSPTSAERSVFKVERILREEFEERGAITLEDALKSQLNIDISQDLAIGSSSVSMQGINSQNVKILVDGIPLVNRNGNGNGADLSQINLQNIERIEIIEGPMAVNYGANALAGVINLITLSPEDDQIKGQVFLQSESAGNEIGIDAGRHIQGALLDFGIVKNLRAQVSAQHNNFLGYEGQADFRQYEWNPKRQYVADAQLSYRIGSQELTYKFGYLNELIKDFGAVQNNFLPNGENQPFAIDEEYDSDRFSHQLLFNGQTNFLKHYNAYASYSSFNRISRQISKNLVTEEESLTTGEGDQDESGFNVFDAGGSLNFSLNNHLDLQTGFQLSLEEALGGRILDGSQQINDYSLYTSAEWSIQDRFTLRPGLRFSYNDAYGDQAIPSIQGKWAISEKDQLRISYGQGFRAPSVRELYFEFIDSNHRIFGNPDLLPEKSDHYSINYGRNYQFKGQQVKASINLFYNDIDQQIAIAQSPNDPTSTSYLNIEKFRTLGTNLTQSVSWAGITGNIGLSYIGRYNRLSDTEEELRPFFFTPEISTNLNYRFKRLGTGLNLFYKFSGEQETYFLNDQDEASIGEREGFHWMDLSVDQKITKRVDLLIGARNLLNVTQINNSGISGGAHSGGPSQPISYGRSYFIKLNYNIN